MTLTVAIPVWNDLPHLRRALDRIDRLGIAERVIVVDDGSDPPLPAGMAARPGTVLIRQPRGRGAGAARNLALARAETPHLLFLDADDEPTPDLPALLAALRGREFDFCIFRHADSRAEAWHRWGQMPRDEALWRAAGCPETGPPVPVGPRAAALLAETANYPWNKIYRTDFLRAHRIACSETPVHNDIALHWDSFRAARRILAAPHPGVLHRVAPGAGRLTNRRGAERLSVFQPLDAVAARLSPAGPAPLLLSFLRFASGLLDWVRGRLDRALHPRFDRRVRHFLIRWMPRPVLDRLIRFDPPLAMRTALQIARGGACPA